MSDRPGQDWLHRVLLAHEQRLIGHAIRLLGDADAARDVTQDTFLALCRTPMEPDDPRLGPWLHRVLRHRAIDRLRKERRMHRLEAADARPAPGIPPALAAERMDEAQRLARVLETLPPRQQEVVWLRFRSGLSYQQIAEITNTTTGSVGSLLHSALCRLRERMGRADWAPAAGEM